MSAQEAAIVRVRDILLVTLPPDPDDSLIAAFQDTVMDAFEQSMAKALIFDLSAVETFDSFLARTVSETASMVALMGGRTSVAGMRPVVAITVVQLGLRLPRVHPALTVDQALDRFLETWGEGWPPS
jgi:rsbT antagonist protein RsbS